MIVAGALNFVPSGTASETGKTRRAPRFLNWGLPCRGLPRRVPRGVPPVACSGPDAALPDAALPDAALPSRVIRGRVIRATHCYPITPLSYHPLSYHPLSYHQLSLHSRAPTKVPTGSPSADRIPKCRQDSRRPQARGKREGLRCVPNRWVGRTDRSAEPVGRTADFWGTGEPASLPQASNPNNTQPEQHAT
jgi:hypothetical protein